MPIVELPNPVAPLGQGDIIKGIPLFVTPSSWATGKTQADDAKFPACLVISRPCVAGHKSRVAVVGVEVYQQQTPADASESLEAVISYLNGLRDGDGARDVFYLGHVPGLAPGRCRARLDSIHMVGMPKAAELKALLPTWRIATLSDDFRRDLHVRLFGAFASLGFDDDTWYGDGDLEWAIQVGEDETSRLRTASATAQAAGTPQKSPKALEIHQARLNRLKRERDRRNPPPAPTPAANSPSL